MLVFPSVWLSLVACDAAPSDPTTDPPSRQPNVVRSPDVGAGVTPAETKAAPIPSTAAPRRPAPEPVPGLLWLPWPEGPCHPVRVGFKGGLHWATHFSKQSVELDPDVTVEVVRPGFVGIRTDARVPDGATPVLLITQGAESPPPGCPDVITVTVDGWGNLKHFDTVEVGGTPPEVP